MMSKLRLSLACSSYDRTRALIDGRVQVEGVELTFLDMPIEEIFFRMLRYQEFDVAEISLSSYTLSLFREPPPFVAIPVFPSRFFRHSCIFVNAQSGIRTPRDLVGKRVASPEYQMTAPVWIRGILSDQYQVPVTSMMHFTGGEEQPGRSEKIALELPPSIRVEPIAPNQTLSRMLETGEIDALFTARTPSSFHRTGGRVRRLFEDYQAVEQEYYQATKIFPIMHTVAIRREVYERYRWLAQALYKAFALALRDAYDDLFDTAALKVMLPWLTRHAELTRDLMGGDFWAYGVEANRPTLETFLRYSFEQGLSKRQLTAEELFAPETFESFKI
jgi:4,5-dihydroxyphthalate decarboxylase